MTQLRQLLALAAFLLVAGAIAFLVFGALFVAVAVVAPVVGLVWLAMKARQARALWKSGGRFPLAGGVRVIEPARARALAAAQLAEGLGGLAFSVLPTCFVFGPAQLVIPAVVVGLAGTIGGGAASRKLLERAHPIDVLPPE